MASQQATVDFIVEQITGAGHVAARKMFGEYGIFCDGKMVAIVADDELLVKPTKAGRAYLTAIVEKPPYEGASNYFLIAGETWDDSDWLTELIRISAAELPLPVKKKPKAKKV
jgi:TfoX/Sxy family transcriptional regulator of competence genes